MPDVPDRLSAGALEALKALRLFAAGSLDDLEQSHREAFREYRDELEAYFLKASERQRPADKDSPLIWSFEAVRRGLDSELAVSFDELSDALYETDIEAMDEDLDDAMVDGYQRELWLLATGGIDIEPYRKELPEKHSRHTLLLALGVLGVSWQVRRGQWRDQARRDVSQWMRASIVGGRTLDETLQGYDNLTKRFTGRVRGLFDEEFTRAFDIGGDVALTAARADHVIQEVWVTRNDHLVCLICKALHMTVTPLQPITDSHPGCRCRKVPVPENYEGQDLRYEDLFPDED